MGCFLTNSSLGRKLVMSISGCFLVLFILFHMSMNIAAIFSAEAYNAICGFLGANWYALVATVVLAGGVFVHFAYAFFEQCYYLFVPTQTLRLVKIKFSYA